MGKAINNRGLLKLLLRLWWLRKRRDFQKRDVFIAVYMLLLYACIGVGVYLGMVTSGMSASSVDLPAIVGLVFVLATLLPDILPKLLMKSGVTVMDDYLKARPVKERTWNVFVLLTNLLSFWCYLVPVLFLPFLIWLLDIWQAVACFFIMILFSLANSMFVTCFRRTSDWFLRTSIIAGWIFMAMSATLSVLLFMWASPWFQDVVLTLLAMAVIAGLVAFMAHEDSHDESRHKATRQHSIGKVTPFTMQFYGIIRAKRMRNMVLFAFLILLADDYFMALVSESGDVSVTIFAIFNILLPSLALSQWTFGVEANFFQGLTTKPISVRQLLANCYYFYIILSVVASIFMMPMLFIWPDFTVLVFLGGLGMALFINLFNLPTCLFSSRLELFSQSFFNMQGANMKINFYALSLLIPFGISAVVWLVFSAETWAVMSMVLGLASLVVHKPVIASVAAKFNSRRYERMESFMK